MFYLKPLAIFDGENLQADKCLCIEDGIVTDMVEPCDVDPEVEVRSVDEILSTGLFDTQVNGGGGVMLNNQPSPEGVRAIASAHRKCGTAFILPTVITDAPEIIERAAEAVAGEVGKNGVLGIHIEGPHINIKHKGTHNTEFIRPFDQNTMSVVEKLREHDIPVLLTLAPELAEKGLIGQLERMGVVVSAGHTAATEAETECALDEGLRTFTHLFNGMPQMTSRAPMVSGAAINSKVWCGIIADGHHVADNMIALAVRARPVADRMVLVSDAMSTIGGPDHFELYGETIRVDGGRLVNSAGSLAGAHTDLRTSVIRMVENVGVDIESALRMAGTNPFDMMRLDRRSIVGQEFNALCGRITCELRV